MTAQPQAEPFDAVEVIRTKRDRGTLSPEQIDWVVDCLLYTSPSPRDRG